VEEHDEDHDNKSKDDEESEEKLPVCALHQKQAVHKTFSPQVALGSDNSHFKQ
jgi:hypothetical protein